MSFGDIAMVDLAEAVDPVCKGFSGAVFDGRFVYYVPLNNGAFHGHVCRYDSAAPFAAANSWSIFDVATVDSNSRGFVNGIYDGRYLYLIPYSNGTHHGRVARYDTQADFEATTSWQVFDTELVDGRSRGFIGGVFDGRYLYLVPYQLDFGYHHGQLSRFDTSAEFSAPGSWETFDMAHLDGDCRGFHGGAFDGRYVYFCPYLESPDPPSFASKVVRHDSRLPLADPTSWSVFDMTEVDPTCKGFIGCVFDGQFMYFVPYNNGHGRYGQVARLRTGSAFTDARSWDTFDTSRRHEGSRGFFGAIFDGRYVYFIPHCKGPGDYNGQMTRLDTQATFSSTDAWRVCDLTALHPANKGFIGGALDGSFLYLAPFETAEGDHSGQTVRIRIDATDIWR